MPTVKDYIEKLQRDFKPEDHIAVHLWQTADVIGYAENEMKGIVVTQEEADNIIDNIHSHLDSEHGITWDTLHSAIADYPLNDISEHPDDFEIPKGFEEDSFLWKWWMNAIGIVGNIYEAVTYIEEQLTSEQHDELTRYASWLSQNNNGNVGRANLYTLYTAFKQEEYDSDNT
jgi:hypothetical protein